MWSRLPRYAAAALVLPLLAASFPAQRAAAQQAKGGEESRVPVVFTGGYETDPQDHGRPVVLIAAALGVPTEAFREAFRHVKPAPAGTEPQPDQVRQNKAALLQALGRYGVTNDRLDEVSNYYRYNRSRGEMWRNTPAAAFATVRNGVVTGFTITNPGSGYSSVPQVSVPGVSGLRATVTLSFSKEFRRNGAIGAVALN